MATSPHNFMDNYGRPDFKLPYRWNNDAPLSIPLGPKNVHATSPYLIGVIDIRWDSPTSYIEHNGYNVLGVNVYRSFDTPEGPYTRLNATPIGALYYRDETREVWADQEDPVAGGRLMAGTNANGDWVVHTYNKPIVIPDTNGDYANHPKHVRVDVRPTSLDDFQTVPAFKVVGETGEIYLNNRKIYNHQFNRLDNPVLPILSSGGEIRVSYTYINNHIQKDANRKVYYKCTTVAVDSSNDEMKETPLNEVEAISLYDMEKIDWIWAESIRRNRWMLEQAGERVKLFIRKWAGEICPCWDIQYRTAKSDCHLCFPAGQKVTYEDGSKRNIEDIKIGDRVLTIDGKESIVSGTMNRLFDGNLVKISVVDNLPLTCTETHPLYVLKKEDSYCVKYAKTYNKNKCSPLNRKMCYRGKTPCSHKLKPVWVDAKDLVVGDYLLIPKISDNCATFNENELFLLGVFAAEGSVSWKHNKFNRVRFSIGSHEKEFRDRILKAYKQCFNKDLRVYKSKNRNCVELYGSDQEVAKFFVENVGLGSRYKKLSNKLMCTPIDLLNNFFVGYFSGDGNIGSKDSYTFSTVSVDLSSQVQLLLNKAGYPCSLFEISQENSTFGGVNIFKGHISSYFAKNFKLIGRRETKVVKKNQKKMVDIGDFIAYPIKEIKKEHFSGVVYNLEVSRNNTYLVNNFVVHNCHGTGYVGGYEGPYDYLIAPPETEKTVQLMDMGLHVSYDWQSWGPPYPLLNDRDFIVRQNNDRLSIAHVNPQGSRGAIYQQHFMLAPLDRRDPRYTVSINGGLDIPAAWNAYRTQRSVDASPVIPNKPEIPDQYERTGRTVTFESIVY